MRIYKDEETRDRLSASSHFSGSTPLNAELSDALIEKLGLTAGLEKLGVELAQGFAARGAGNPVAGVDITGVRFTLIFDERED